MNSALRQQAVELRTRQNLSYGEIRKRLKVSKSTLSYWLRDFPLPEEKIRELRLQAWKKGEASRERFRNTMVRKKEAADQLVYKRFTVELSKLSKRERFIAGLVLYLGEGSKKKMGQLCLVNMDPELCRFFIEWGTEFLNVKRSDFKVLLHLYDTSNLEKEIKFWQNALAVKRSQFYKPSLRKAKSHSIIYTAGGSHGTCALYLYGMERQRIVRMATRALLDQLKLRV